MSKAAEWVTRKPHQFRGIHVQAWVSNDGDAVVQTNGNQIPPTEALALAQWILDIYGEAT